MRTTRSRRPAASVFVLALVLSACSFNNGYVLDVAIDGGDRGAVVGESLALSASVVRGGGATDRVTWSSSDASVATIDAEGRLASIAPGPTLITATSVSDPSNSDTITVTVDPPGAVRWTRQFGTAAADDAYGVATDANGHAYAAGSTHGALDGSNAGGSDAFVRAYDADGTLRWTRQFGTAADDVAYGIATGTNGQVYVAGSTRGALAGSNAGGSDVFVRAYDLDGTLRWTRQFGTTADEDAYGVATGTGGHVYVVGSTGGSLDEPSAGGVDAFVRAYDADGTLRWARQFGTAVDDFAWGIATDADGNLHVAGSTRGTLDTSAGGSDGFLRTYGADGALRWTRQFGTNQDDGALGVATDAGGRVYVAGLTAGTLDGSHAGAFDAFVRAYDADGTLRWARQFGTTALDIAYGVATDASGTVYVAGMTGGALDGSNAGGGDAVVRAYDPNGDLRWSRQFGTTANDFARGVAVAASGHAYAAGYTTGAFDGSNVGGNDAFVRAYGR